MLAVAILFIGYFILLILVKHIAWHFDTKQAKTYFEFEMHRDNKKTKHKE